MKLLITSLGYTLIELLLVIAIIGALIAILVPQVRVIQNVARQAGCLSNIGQIGLGEQCYAQDHQGYLMPSSTVDSGSSVYWTKLIENYLPIRTRDPGSKSIFQCPQVRSDFPTYTGYFGASSAFKGSNYAMNPNIHPIYLFPPVRRTRILRSSEMISLMDSGVDVTTSGSIELQAVNAGIYQASTLKNQVCDGPGGVGVWAGNNNQDNNLTNSSNGTGGVSFYSSRLCPRWRHGNNLRGVAVFVDGHAEARERAQTFMLHFINAY